MNKNSRSALVNVSVGLQSTSYFFVFVVHLSNMCFFIIQAGADPDYGCVSSVAKKRHLPNCQSLFHSVLRKPCCSWKFVAFLRDFGANMWLTDDQGKLAYESIDTGQSECKQYIMEVIGTISTDFCKSNIHLKNMEYLL